MNVAQLRMDVVVLWIAAMTNHLPTPIAKITSGNALPTAAPTWVPNAVIPTTVVVWNWNADFTHPT